MDVKSYIVQILRAQGQKPKANELDLWLLLCHYVSKNRKEDYNEDIMVSNARKAIEGLRTLEQMGLINKNDGFSQLKTEIIEVVNQLIYRNLKDSMIIIEKLKMKSILSVK